MASGGRPRGRAPLREARSMLHFGRHMATFNLLNYLSRNADNVLIGWARGPVELGLYDRAYKLMLFPLQQINGPIANVMIPLLSRLRDEPERYRAAYMRTLQLMLLISVPGVFVLLLTANRLIPFLMGAQWKGIVPIFIWLGIAGVYQTLTNTFGWLFISQGRAVAYSRFGMFSTALCLVAFVAGLPWGAVGVAAAYGLSGLVIRTPAQIWVLGRQGPIGWPQILQLFLPYIVSSSLAAGAWWGITRVMKAPDLVYFIVSGVTIYAVTWAVLCAFRDGRAAFANGLQMIRSTLGR
jgi:PST family polysaccharide transporter